MKTSFKTGLRRALKSAGVGATVAVAIGFASVGAANADTFVPLEDGSISQTLPGGITVTVTRTDEKANISPSMGATPLHRNVWVSGTAKVDISGPGADKLGGRIQPGYIVGCQLGMTANLGAGAGLTGGASSTSSTPTAGASVTGNAGITLTPNQAYDYKVLDLTQSDPWGAEVHRNYNTFKGATGSVTWGDSTLGVTGCAGYAQARSYVKVTVDTATTTQQVTLWGQPFSIG
ncbi:MULTISPECIES: MspA family porin [Rhodococcus]|uniref:MspA family porin n=1 Tax=Rhodococcus TaxID=1827 RepID=UPI000622C486|nr:MULTISPECIES: MspA family porin [Rhodococcus]AKE91193.1 porin [Rhodococcus aetherivorans]PND51462.1 porin [Rhodococcus sp. ENV425]QRI78085.1 MspA family porin [Rhodococcus aetherivorans]QSE61500.1 MspA family porin [Rhodococcus sp. PSBB066]QSE67190.1 MspA family porin [Rhodococcus sp. PSBB049]